MSSWASNNVENERSTFVRNKIWHDRRRLIVGEVADKVDVPIGTCRSILSHELRTKRVN